MQKGNPKGVDAEIAMSRGLRQAFALESGTLV
jgi:hypothetical protein